MCQNTWTVGWTSAGTFDVERLRDYMALGITRFSIGVQVLQAFPANRHRPLVSFTARLLGHLLDDTVMCDAVTGGENRA